MKLRRLIPLALAAYAGWKRLSPQTKAQLKRRLSRSGSAPVRQTAD